MAEWLKGKFYNQVTNTNTTIWIQTLSLQKTPLKKFGVVEMHMLRWMIGHNINDRYQNEDIWSVLEMILKIKWEKIINVILVMCKENY